MCTKFVRSVLPHGEMSEGQRGEKENSNRILCIELVKNSMIYLSEIQLIAFLLDECG